MGIQVRMMAMAKSGKELKLKDIKAAHKELVAVTLKFWVNSLAGLQTKLTDQRDKRTTDIYIRQPLSARLS